MRITRVEIRQQLRRTNGCCADLSDSETRGVVSQCCRFFHRCPTGLRQSERGDNSVPGSRYIEYVTRECRQVVRSARIKQRHAFFAAGDQGIGALELLEQLAACFLELLLI